MILNLVFQERGKILRRNSLIKIYMPQHMLTTLNIIDIFVRVDQQFYKLTKKKINFLFNPHLLPTFRGILTSIYIHPKKRK